MKTPLFPSSPELCCILYYVLYYIVYSMERAIYVKRYVCKIYVFIDGSVRCVCWHLV